MRRLLALGMLLAVVGTPAHAAGPVDLVGRFITAWNAHDPKAFEALYTADAVWVPVAEARTHGRDAIVADFAAIHGANGWASHTTIAQKDVPEVQSVDANVVDIFFHMDFIADGKPVAGLQRAMILVAKKEGGGWKIAAGQLTKESPAPTR